MALLANSQRHAAPTAQDASLARMSGQRLSRFARGTKPLSLRLTEAGQEQPIELPAGAVALLMDILEAMAAGRGVTIIPENAELTTVQAADILSVSRPYLIKLLDDGTIPHRLVGKHRRILIDDLMDYKQRIDAKREDALARLTAQAQEEEMGYSLK